MTGRNELRVAVGLCLLGPALVLLALSRAWLSGRLPAAAPLPAKTFALTGSQLVPGARALALVGLAGVAALPAARQAGRVVVGVLIAAAGVGLLTVLLRAVLDPTGAVRRGESTVDAQVGLPDRLGGWPYVGILGGLLLVVAGVLVAVRGRRWGGMSERYDAPAREAPKEPSLWDALDRGEDPTGTPPLRPSD